MDDVLHGERLDGRAKQLHKRKLDDLPDGVFITLSGEDAFAIKGKQLLRWTPASYTDRRARPTGIEVQMLTPPSIARVLARGYAALARKCRTIAYC
jgi:hypothetical protein